MILVRSRLKQNLLELLSGVGKSMRVKELSSRGVDSVRVLGADQLAALMERALDRVLEHRVLELTDFERARMLEHAQEEFEKLRLQVEGLEGDTERKRRELSEIEAQLGGLHVDFQKANASLDAELIAAAQLRPPAPVELETEVEVLLPIVSQAGVNDPAVARRVAHAVAVHLRAERGRAAESEACAQRGRIDMLERRLAKLNETLARTEEELERALEETGRDGGVASIFRTVQGLRETARDFERKRSMLADIFEKNLLLQKGAASPAGDRTAS
jgi:hypothetical protein